MKVLIIILIIALLVQTGVFTYSHFFDINTHKAEGATIDMLNSAVQNFVQEKANLERAIHSRDDIIKSLQDSRDELAKMHNLTVLYLPDVIQKDAMRHIVNGETEKYPDSIEVLKDYLELLKNITYNDEHKKIQ